MLQKYGASVNILGLMHYTADPCDCLVRKYVPVTPSMDEIGTMQPVIMKKLKIFVSGNI